MRLHEEILTVTARWTDPASRKGHLSPYGRDAEGKTLDLLEEALRNGNGQTIPEPVERRLRAAMAPDIEELLPHLGQRGQNAKGDAEKRLAERGRAESESMLRILEEQKKRVAEQAGRSIQLDLFNEAEKRQIESNRKYWQRWLVNVEGDIEREPARIMDFYTVASFRIEPIGLTYLWPVTG